MSNTLANITPVLLQAEVFERIKSIPSKEVFPGRFRSYVIERIALEGGLYTHTVYSVYEESPFYEPGKPSAYVHVGGNGIIDEGCLEDFQDAVNAYAALHVHRELLKAVIAAEEDGQLNPEIVP